MFSTGPATLGILLRYCVWKEGSGRNVETVALRRLTVNGEGYRMRRDQFMVGDDQGFPFVGFSASRSGSVARGAAMRAVWHEHNSFFDQTKTGDLQERFLSLAGPKSGTLQ